MCIPTRVVSPAVTSTAGFLRANIARMNKVVTIYKLTNNYQASKSECQLSKNASRRESILLTYFIPFTLINLKCLEPTKPALTTTAKKIHKHEAN